MDERRKVENVPLGEDVRDELALAGVLGAVSVEESVTILLDSRTNTHLVLKSPRTLMATKAS